jgi:ATP-dependent DNA helicase RecQ
MNITTEQFLAHSKDLAKKHFGIETLRPEQLTVLKEIFENKGVLATLPTGGGKTLLYALPALFYEKQGPVVVISPLIALMRDQMKRMLSASIPSCTLNSEQNDQDRLEAMKAIKTKTACLIFLSPERLHVPYIRDLMIKVQPSIVVVDEAHCVASWGHHFRPEYTNIHKIFEAINPQKILALTATAGSRTQQDIIKYIFPSSYEVKLYSSFPLRDHIALKSERVFSLEEKWRKLLSLLHKTTSQKSLVYFPTRQACEDYAKKLRKEKIKAFVYHAGLSKEERQQCELYVQKTTQKIVICATNAFGMGIDLKSLQLVMVYGFPSHIEEFLQMIGRAGRQGEPSEGILLWSGDDPVRREYQFHDSFPDKKTFFQEAQKLLTLLPQEAFERVFVPSIDLLKHLTLKDDFKKQKKLYSYLSILRICQCLEEPSSFANEDYITFSLKGKSFESLFSELPSSKTQRGELLLALKQEMGPLAFDSPSLTFTCSLPKLASLSKLSFETICRVFDSYKDVDALAYKIIPHTLIKNGVFLTSNLEYLKNHFFRYLSIRAQQLEGLQELIKFAKTNACLIEELKSYFCPNDPFTSQTKSCSTCSNCLKRKIKKVYQYEESFV